MDHHNPTLPARSLNAYNNLYPAARHCNNAKSDRWPSRAEQADGLRFLDCCSESDYNRQIFEDPRNNKLWGTTKAARYHIIYCDLNAPHFMRERAQRAGLRKLLTGKMAQMRGNEWSQVQQLVGALGQMAELMIPPIDFKQNPAWDWQFAAASAQ